jgi:tRNA dimethylallyltransferase
MKKILIITGPTAVGKSAAAVKLAQQLNGEIISADSMQIYKGMDIGTAKIKPTEMQSIPHYLIDELNPDQTYNAAIFRDRAKALIDDISAKGKLPIICGGTGFYINALLYDVDFDGQSGANPGYRATLQQIAQGQGKEKLYEMLQKTDPEAAEAIGPNNIKRLIRALEYHNTTGQKISGHNAAQRAKQPAYNAQIQILTAERAWLYNRINQRVDSMMQEGLLNEVQTLLNKGFSKDLTSMQAIGYKELIRHLNGQNSEYNLETAIDAIKQGTRRFAKRQITWFKHRLPQAEWIDMSLMQDGD